MSAFQAIPDECLRHIASFILPDHTQLLFRQLVTLERSIARTDSYSYEHMIGLDTILFINMIRREQLYDMITTFNTLQSCNWNLPGQPFPGIYRYIQDIFRKRHVIKMRDTHMFIRSLCNDARFCERCKSYYDSEYDSWYCDKCEYEMEIELQDEIKDRKRRC